MEYRPLGRTDLKVSALCLGSMTWGSQNTEAEAHAQIDRALDAGVNFIDTAEMYPVTPHAAETSGDSERLIGTWLSKTGRRADVILASKVVGEGYKLIRDGARMTPATMRTALEDSLRKLQTDYIDLYQLHWPNRGSYHFLNHWNYAPETQDTAAALSDIQEQLQALQTFIREGKIRHIGLSNETAWGVMRFVRAAEEMNLPRIATIQNEYSLMRRFYDLDLAEVSHHEGVGLLAYTPLGGGLLSGKYADGAIPAGSRASINDNIGGRRTERGIAVAQTYVEIAKKHGLDPSQMALAWCLERPFMASVIFGATNMEQLDTALGAADVTLSNEVREDILDAYKANPRSH